MSSLFEELDYRVTPIGAVSLRRRRDLSTDVDIYEIKLGDEFLMSSMFTSSEIALSQLALAELSDKKLDVLVGGLGLGYTAQAVLENANVNSLIVIELLDAVIDWHESGLLPLGKGLTTDKRCQFRQGDFFHLARQKSGFDSSKPGRQFDAILLDIDHSPESFLDERNSGFYKPDSLRQLAMHIKPGGVFGLWSNDKPDPVFTKILQNVFATAFSERVVFFNPLQQRQATQTVYLGRKGLD